MCVTVQIASPVCALLNVVFEMSVLVRVSAFCTGLNYLYTCGISELAYFNTVYLPVNEVTCDCL